MDTTSLSSNSPSLIIIPRRSLPSSTRHKNHQILLPQRHGSLTFHPISCTSSSSSSSNTNADDADSVQAPTATTPAEPEVRFRRRSRRQSRRQRENGTVSDSMQPTKSKALESTPKKWEDMTLTEKALELYVGEKGALFWLNKFAYASIFIMIGAWILFRFVGPSLNLYQLDSPPLSPADVLKGSSWILKFWILIWTIGQAFSFWAQMLSIYVAPLPQQRIRFAFLYMVLTTIV